MCESSCHILWLLYDGRNRPKIMVRLMTRIRETLQGGYMKSEIDIIEIEWEGPLPMKYVETKLNRAWDCGVYQIYGTHTIFGPDSLLYIGKARDCFAERIPAHIEWTDWESRPVRVYVGRLGGGKGTEDMGDKSRWGEWTTMINAAEKLLIYYTSPPYNSSGIRNLSLVTPTLVINYKHRNRLPYAVTNWEWIHETDSEAWKKWRVFGKR